MRKTVFINTLLLMCLCSFPQEIPIMPYPAQVEMTKRQLSIDSTFAISIQQGQSERIEFYTQFFLEQITNKTGAEFTAKKKNCKLYISFIHRSNLDIDTDESYQLNIYETKIMLQSKTDIGIIRGLESLLQLVQQDTSGIYFPCMKIKDTPRFVWRGLLVDVSRHFQPMSVLKRTLDGMALVKMNTLHLHLTDDQAFAIECKTYPLLHEKGSGGQYFTHNDIKEIIAYADLRGIRVIPEFDMPGHTTSWLVAYPELATVNKDYVPEPTFGIMDPVMDPSDEYTYTFLDSFFMEMASLFPGPYIHIGGDENNGKHWNESKHISAFKAKNNIKDNHELQQYFNKRIITILAKYNKQVVGWDEILTPNLPKEAIIQSWRGKQALIDAAKRGYKTMLSNGYYIDLCQSTEFHYLNDPLPDYYLLTDEQKSFILGGEATMWSELVDSNNVDTRIWPRTAAIAERLWSPREIKDVRNMYSRLEKINQELTIRELTQQTYVTNQVKKLSPGNPHVLYNFLDLLEPLKEYTRHQYTKYTVDTPLNRVVDLTRPDAPGARKFRWLVDDYLDNKNDSLYLGIFKQLNQWTQDYYELVEICNNSQKLKEILPQLENLKQLTEVGSIALEYLHKQKNKPTVDWNQKSLAIIKKAKQPVGETELMITSAIEELIVHSIYL